ncbi:MAG: lipoprotein LpqH [Actinomycetota bacterium]|nr:lipoprotein LpqH [Actinomycetota bacterium]
MHARRRAAVALGGLAVFAVAGCSAPEPALGGKTATVAIDGRDVDGVEAVRCNQSGWAWYIETPESSGGFTAVLHTGPDVTVESVQFRDLGGFSGTFWADHIGEAEVDADGGSFTITGSADGNFSDDPSAAATARFRIAAQC